MKFYPNICQQYRDNSIARAVSAGWFIQDDGDLIRAYVLEYQAIKHVKEHRVQKTTFDLIQWRRFIPAPYRSCTIDQVYGAINQLPIAMNHRGRPFKQNTRHDYVKALRLFLIWLIENAHNTSIPVEKIRKIRIPPRDYTTTTPDQILTPEEVSRIIEACSRTRERSRNRAIISTLYESGCRVGELARLRWRDVVFDEFGVKLTITDTKTNKIRYSRLITAKDYLIALKNDTHGSISGDSLVFISERGDPLEYPALLRVIQRTAMFAGVQKRVHPHLFRKSRITHLIQQNYQESVVKQMMWGNLNTGMFRTYAVLSNADIDAEVLDRYGVKKKGAEKQGTAMDPRQCPNCLKMHSPTTKYCECGHPLTPEAIATREAIRAAFRKDPMALMRELQEIAKEDI